MARESSQQRNSEQAAVWVGLCRKASQRVKANRERPGLQVSGRAGRGPHSPQKVVHWKAEPAAPSVEHWDQKGWALRASLVPLAARRSRAKGLARKMHRLPCLQPCSCQALSARRRKELNQCTHTKPLSEGALPVTLDFLPAWNSTLVPSPCTPPRNSWSRKNSLHLKGIYNKKINSTRPIYYRKLGKQGRQRTRKTNGG